MTKTSEPRIQTHGRRLTVVRFVNGQHQFWNGLRCQWIKAADFHGSSANNPKISFFASYARASFELTIIARSLTPEAAADERSEWFKAEKRKKRHAQKTDNRDRPHA